MGRLLRPVDVAATVGHLLSDSSAMMTGTIVDLHPERVSVVVAVVGVKHPANTGVNSTRFLFNVVLIYRSPTS